ncbi:carbohydrate-binding family 9-like protein [Paludibaculum fermentans]|uniref:Carbohydrate-binding family 9-like protein n=1 Tax=Paludibaculum fermentans TaxID=1473598 RepID=A0A7S7NUX4_PALFE|nr:carbohydrate-binding family 9-like protein [Paludibaculum fermentans]QOY90195.1 carbohydrate-binding family 9-like protein [Paludibaculum fermentans]
MVSAPNNAFRSLYAPGEALLHLDPQDPFWRKAPALHANRDPFGRLSPKLETTIRSRWTGEHLYVLFECPYQTLHLKPEPILHAKTWLLWNWDVVELFIGDDWEHIERYKEFELSPQGEWLDLAIDRNPPEIERHRAWASGMKTRAHVDEERRLWLGAMRIPFASITDAAVGPGKTFRANLYRIEGAPEERRLVAWMATGSESFHVPAAFGTLELVV